MVSIIQNAFENGKKKKMSERKGKAHNSTQCFEATSTTPLNQFSFTYTDQAKIPTLESKFEQKISGFFYPRPIDDFDSLSIGLSLVLLLPLAANCGSGAFHPNLSMNTKISSKKVRATLPPLA